MFKRKMRQGYDELYFKNAKALLERNPSPIIMQKVLGEQQYQLYMEHGWELHQAESRSYGQLFTHRYMKIERGALQMEVNKHYAGAA